MPLSAIGVRVGRGHAMAGGIKAGIVLEMTVQAFRRGQQMRLRAFTVLIALVASIEVHGEFDTDGV